MSKEIAQWCGISDRGTILENWPSSTTNRERPL
jgi:hypothetical protein